MLPILRRVRQFIFVARFPQEEYMEVDPQPPTQTKEKEPTIAELFERGEAAKKKRDGR